MFPKPDSEEPEVRRHASRPRPRLASDACGRGPSQSLAMPRRRKAILTQSKSWWSRDQTLPAWRIEHFGIAMAATMMAGCVRA